MKLTAKQIEVILDLQQGSVIITDSSMKGAIISGDKKQYHINNGIFYRLVDKGLIYQGDWAHDRYNYVLTKLGKEIKI